MKQIIEPTYDPSMPHMEDSVVKRVSWGAIFAGVTAAVIVQLLLTLLGVGIGAATVNPLQEQAPGQGLGVGAAIWFFVSSIIAMYVGGLVAGRFSNAPLKRDRMSHGVFTWAATTILSAVFLASALTSLLGSAAGSAAGTTAVQVKSTQPGAPQAAVSASPDARKAAAPTVNEQQAREAADVAAKRVSQTALGTFFLLVLTGIAAAVGGCSSARRTARDDVRIESETHHGAPLLAKS